MREAGREVEGTAPPRIEASTPGTKFPSGPVDSPQHPLNTLDATGRSESTVTIVGPSREGVRATPDVSTPGVSPPCHSPDTRAKRVDTGGPYHEVTSYYYLWLKVFGSKYRRTEIVIVSVGNLVEFPGTDKCELWCENDATVKSHECGTELIFVLKSSRSDLYLTMSIQVILHRQ